MKPIIDGIKTWKLPYYVAGMATCVANESLVTALQEGSKAAWISWAVYTLIPCIVRTPKR